MASPENKTRPTDASVQDYLASRASEQQQGDCQQLMALLKKVTKQSPRMWGKSCLYFKRLADLDRVVLEKLVAGSISEVLSFG